MEGYGVPIAFASLSVDAHIFVYAAHSSLLTAVSQPRRLVSIVL